MYGHELGNVTPRVRKRERQKTNWEHFSRNAIEERRFIVRITIVAFPTVPLLQQAGILYRRPPPSLQVTHKERLSHLGKRRAHAHVHTLILGIRRAHTYNRRFTSQRNHSEKGRNTDFIMLNNHRKPQHPNQSDPRDIQNILSTKSFISLTRS